MYFLRRFSISVASPPASFTRRQSVCTSCSLALPSNNANNVGTSTMIRTIFSAPSLGLPTYVIFAFVSSKAYASILTAPASFSIITDVRLEQFLKAHEIFVTLLGIVIDVKPVQPSKPKSLVTLFVIVIDVRPVQPLNAL